MRSILASLTLIFSLISTAIADNAGEYSVHLQFTHTVHEKNEVIANLHLIANLPKSTGVIHIPLPIDKNEKFETIIASDSDNNLVLHGFMRELDRFALYQISLNSEQNSKVHLVVKNIKMSIHRSERSEDIKVIKVLFEDAFKELKSHRLSSLGNPKLTKVSFEINDYKDSVPVSISMNNSPGRIFRLNRSDGSPQNLSIYIGKSQSEASLYIVIGIMGILLGYVGAPKFVTTRTKALSVLIGSIVLALVFVGLFFGYLTEMQRLSDTTTIVTFGSIFGLIIGLLANSIQFLVGQSQAG